MESTVKTYIKAVSELKPFFSAGRWTKEPLSSLAEDASDKEVHECRD